MSHIVLQDIWISSVRLQLHLHVVYTTTQACILCEPIVTLRPQAQPDRLYFCRVGEYNRERQCTAIIAVVNQICVPENQEF